jgi:hypothetical protein
MTKAEFILRAYADVPKASKKQEKLGPGEKRAIKKKQMNKSSRAGYPALVTPSKTLIEITLDTPLSSVQRVPLRLGSIVQTRHT